MWSQSQGQQGWCWQCRNWRPARQNLYKFFYFFFRKHRACVQTMRDEMDALVMAKDDFFLLYLVIFLFAFLLYLFSAGEPFLLGNLELLLSHRNLWFLFMCLYLRKYNWLYWSLLIAFCKVQKRLCDLCLICYNFIYLCCKMIKLGMHFKATTLVKILPRLNQILVLNSVHCKMVKSLNSI